MNFQYFGLAGILKCVFFAFAAQSSQLCGMRKACCILLLVTLCVVCIACKASPSTSAGTGPSAVSELIAEADRLLASQDFDGAMERSLRALELSAEDPLL